MKRVGGRRGSVGVSMGQRCREISTSGGVAAWASSDHNNASTPPDDITGSSE